MVLVDPVTREPLGPLMTEHEYQRDLRVRDLRAAHWGGKPGWQTGEDRENGIPVRIWFRECAEECPCWELLK